MTPEQEDALARASARVKAQQAAIEAAQARLAAQRPEPAAPPGGRPGSIHDVLQTAMTFGLNNEMGGAASVIGPALRAAGSLMGIPGVEYKSGEMSDAYSRGRDASVRRTNEYRKANPDTAFAAEMVAGVASPISRLLPNAKQGGTWYGNAGRSAFGGGIGGGVLGFNQAEGDLANRAEDAVLGSLIGAGIGAPAPAVISGIAKGGQYIGDQFIRRFSGTGQATAAARKLAEALERDNMTPDAAMARIQALGPRAALMDAGTNTQELAAAVARTPGRGKATLNDFVTARQEGTRDANNVLSGSQSQRIMGAIDNLIPDKVDDTLKDAAAKRMAAGRNYEAAKQDEVNNLVDISPLIKSLDGEIESSKGSISASLARVRSFLVDKKGNPEVTINSLHQAKMAIDDLMTSGDARNSMGRVAHNRIKDYQSQLLSAIENSGPGGAQYATGRGATSATWRTQEALENGASFMNKAEYPNAKAIGSDLAKMTPDDLHAFRMGAAQAIKGKIGGFNIRLDATKRVMDIPALEDKIRTAFGNEDVFRQYIGMLKNERTMFDTYAGIKGNSKTAERIAADADLNKDPGGMAQDVLGIVANPTNPMGYLRAGARSIENALTKMGTPEPIRSRLADLLAGTDPTALRQATQSLRMSQQDRNRLTRALTSGGAVYGGRPEFEE